MSQPKIDCSKLWTRRADASRFPEDREVIITDTVGFIRDLPQELVGAFRTTLEELREADLLLHVVDGSAADIDIQITAVVAILEDLHLNAIPRLLVFNKCDRISPLRAELLCRRYGAIGISALQPDHTSSSPRSTGSACESSATR